MKKTSESYLAFEQDLAGSIQEWLAPTRPLAIGIIGSYPINREVLPGSDVDVVVVVEHLSKILVDPKLTLHKMGHIVDPQGERFEFNSRLPNGTTIDVTVIDSFNTPNNPLRDAYENHIGWCESALPIYGPRLRDFFELESRKTAYESIREGRLSLVEDKIVSTKRKIRDQGRFDIHVLFELQQYIFFREVIKAKTFNRQSIKHADDCIPGFSDLFSRELLRDCGVRLEINRTRHQPAAGGSL